MYYRTIEWKYQNENLQIPCTSWKYYNFGVVSLSNVRDPFFTYVGQSRKTQMSSTVIPMGESIGS